MLTAECPAWERAPSPRALPVVCGLTGWPADLHSAGVVHFLHAVPWAASPKVVPHTCTVPVPTPAKARVQPRCPAPLLLQRGFSRSRSGLSSRHLRSVTSQKAISSCSPPRALKKPHPKGVPPPLSQVPFQQPLGRGEVGRDPGWESGPCQERWGQGHKGKYEFKKERNHFPEGKRGKKLRPFLLEHLLKKSCHCECFSAPSRGM